MVSVFFCKINLYNMLKKSIITTITIVCSTIITFAQTDKKNTITTMNLQGNVSSLETKVYDAKVVDGNIEQGDIKRSFVYSFFADGNLKEQQTIANNGVLLRKYVYQYDAQGREILKLWYNNKQLNQSIVSTYKDDLLSTCVTKDINNQLIDSIIYTYNSGILIQEENFYVQQGELLSKKIDYTFNNGLLIAKKMENIDLLQLQYNDKKQIIKEKQCNTQGESIFIYEYNYDNQGNIVTKNSLRDNGELRRKFVYEYDKYGNVTSEKWLDSGGMQLYQQTYKYSYDDYGNWIVRTTYQNPEQVTEMQVRIINYY